MLSVTQSYLVGFEMSEFKCPILVSALPVHRHSLHGHQTHPAAFLLSAGM